MNETPEKLRAAADGLFFMSESDYPFEVIEVDTANSTLEKELVKLSGRGDTPPPEKQSLDYFFRNSIASYPGESEEQKATNQRFVTLKNLLQQLLKDTAVYRVGQVQVDVFIVGLLSEGKYAGLRTKSIET